MPRAARIDYPGLIQHVIIRGIERGKIFLDDQDRQLFLDRFSHLLEQTGTDCLAWTLLDNHVHFLLRIGQTCSLACFMRRLLTGHATSFNLRHRRSGHLLQNRYKSIVCEEELYLLELVRYIHLNPLRGGLVPDRTALGSAQIRTGARCRQATSCGIAPARGPTLRPAGRASSATKEKPAGHRSAQRTLLLR